VGAVPISTFTLEESKSSFKFVMLLRFLIHLSIAIIRFSNLLNIELHFWLLWLRRLSYGFEISVCLAVWVERRAQAFTVR